MNCSLSENSKIWNQKNSISKKDKKLQIILDEKKETIKELNPKFKLNLSKIKFNNDIFNNYNNFGTQSYSGKFDKIGIYKFSKFDEVTELYFKPLFL